MFDSNTRTAKGDRESAIMDQVGGGRVSVVDMCVCLCLHVCAHDVCTDA